MKIHGWFMPGTFTKPTPPRLDRSETAISIRMLEVPPGETGPLADSWKNPSVPQGVILKVYSISICDVCQRSPPRRMFDSPWLTSTFKTVYLYGGTSRRVHENLMGNIRRNEDLAWRLAKQHTWQPKNKQFLLLGYQLDGEPNLYIWKMDRNHHFHPFFQVVV